jgi:hypothetical protein
MPNLSVNRPARKAAQAGYFDVRRLMFRTSIKGGRIIP